MKPLVLAVFLAIMQAAPPVPGKTPNSSASAGEEVKNEGSAKQQPTAQSLTTVNNPVKPQSAKGDGTQQAKENTDHTVAISKLPPVSITRSWPDWGLWVFNGLLVLVGAFQVGLLLGTLRAIKRQADNMDRQLELIVSKERARLLVKFKPAESYKGDEYYYRFETMPVTGIGDETIYMEVTQHGPTDALNVFAHGEVIFSESKTPPPTMGTQNDFFPTLIEGGDRTPVPLHVDIEFAGEDQVDAIRNETLFAHLFGVITYDDIFGRSHRTPFRYLWKVDGFSNGDGWQDTSDWVTWGDPEDNRAT